MPIAWFGAFVVGFSLGLIGAGGSILTVPVLIYLVGQTDKVAITGSLAVVGGTSLVGALPYIYRNRVDWGYVVLFGVPGMAGAYGGAYLAQFVPGTFQLMVFGIVVVLAGVLMIRPVQGQDSPRASHAYWKMTAEGLALGIVTGFVGVGGGFLIVPALIFLGRLPMRIAVGTSLLIITLKSLSGFYKYLDVLSALHLSLDWEVIGLFTILGTVGSLAGSFVSPHLPQQALRRVFAGFLFVVGIFIVWQNFS
jgi:uncharacterized membrane protein YfcA